MWCSIFIHLLQLTFISLTSSQNCSFVEIAVGIYLKQDFGETVQKTIAATPNCSATCVAETSFVCTAYLWSPHNGGECVLFDKINLNLQVIKDGGAFNLYDQACNNATLSIGIGYCQFELTQSNVAVTAPSVSPGMVSASNCQDFCVAHYTGVDCTAYSVANNGMGFFTCNLYKSVTPAEISAGGNMDLYAMVCHTAPCSSSFVEIADGVNSRQGFGETMQNSTDSTTDCSANCQAETSFVCTAYLWAPPSGPCTWFDKINLNLQVFKDGGALNLYNQACKGSKPMIGYCQFEVTQSSVAVSAPSISLGMMSASNCHDECVTNDQGVNCTAYTVSHGGMNTKSTCKLYESITPADISAGTLDLHTIVCYKPTPLEAQDIKIQTQMIQTTPQQAESTTETGGTQPVMNEDATTQTQMMQTNPQLAESTTEIGGTQQGTTGTNEPIWVPWPSSTKKTTTKPLWHTTGKQYGTTESSSTRFPLSTQRGNTNDTATENNEIDDVLQCSVQCAQYWFQKAKQLFTEDNTGISMQQCDCDRFPFRSFGSKKK